MAAATRRTTLQVCVTRDFCSHSLRVDGGILSGLVSCMIRSVVVRVPSSGTRVVLLRGIAVLMSSGIAADSIAWVVAIAHNPVAVARLCHRRQHIGVALGYAAHGPTAKPALLRGTSHVTMRRVSVPPGTIVRGRIEAKRTDGLRQGLSTFANNGEDDGEEHDASQGDCNGDDCSLAQTAIRRTSRRLLERAHATGRGQSLIRGDDRVASVNAGGDEQLRT